MLYVFNDTGIQTWELVKKNEKFFKLCAKDQNVHVGIDILMNFSTETDYDLNKLVNPADARIEAISTLNYNVCYNDKSGYAFLKPIPRGVHRKFTNDLYLITYKIPEGAVLIKEQSMNFHLHFATMDLANNICYMIGTARDNAIPNLFVTFATKANEDGIRDHYWTKDLVCMKTNKAKRIYIKEYTREEAEASKFSKYIMASTGENAFTIYHPPYPYGVIVYPFEGHDDVKTTCLERWHKREERVVFIDANISDLQSELRRKYTERYNAASFYVDETYDDLMENGFEIPEYTNIFKNVNFITKDMKILNI